MQKFLSIASTVAILLALMFVLTRLTDLAGLTNFGAPCSMLVFPACMFLINESRKYL